MTTATSSTASSNALSGLASGLDTSGIIASLMTAAKQPQVLLQQQITTAQSNVTSLQTLNTQFATLSTAIESFTGSNTLQAYTTSVSQPGAATATASSTASVGSIGFTVDALAQQQVLVTAPYTSWPSSPPAFTFTSGDGTVTSVTAASQNLDDVIAAINGSTAGMTAQKVQAGTDGSGDPVYRLQLASNQSGIAGEFTVTDATSGQDLSAQPGAAITSQAQDAQLTLWPGTAAAQTITSSSNDFTDVLPGVKITATQTSTTPVTVTVAQDLTTEAGTVGSLVSSVTTVLNTIDTGTATATQTNADGSTQVVFGPFTADSTVRGARQDLVDAMTLDVNGTSPSTIGIELDEKGNISFDSASFTAAMQKDPVGTTSLFNTIMGRVDTLAKQVSDPYTGTLTSEISNDNDAIDAMQTKSDSMTDLLNQQQSNLEQQFAYMETMMSQIQSQGSYLQSYFDAVDSSSSSSSKKS